MLPTGKTNNLQRLLLVTFIVPLSTALSFPLWAAAANDYFVAVGSYQELAGAERAVALASNQLGNTHQLLSANSATGTLYRVVSGPYASHAVATEVVSQAKASGYAGAWVLAVPAGEFAALPISDTVSTAISTTASNTDSGLRFDGTYNGPQLRADVGPNGDQNAADLEFNTQYPDLPPLEPLPPRGGSSFEQSTPRAPLPKLIEEAPASYRLHRLNRNAEVPANG